MSFRSGLTIFTVVTLFCISATTLPYAYADAPTFDKDIYGLDETATITLIDAPGDGVKIVHVASNSDNVGFDITLTEIDTSGVYQGMITFSTDASISVENILRANEGDLIAASFDGAFSLANIEVSAPESGLAFEFGSYTMSSGAVGSAPVIITLINAEANTNPETQETVDVTVTSEPTGDSTTLRLTETDVDSGIFKNTNLIFMTGSDLIRPGSGTVTQNEPLFAGDEVISTLSVLLRSTTFPSGITLELTEDNSDTGLFSGYVIFSLNNISHDNVLQVSNSDIVSVTYNDESENGLAVPNDPGVGAIQAAIGDTITVSYMEESDTATISPGLGGGGGGGGLIRPGLVLNLLAGLGSGIDVSSPSLNFGSQPNTEDSFAGILINDENANSFPLVINGMGYYLPAFSTTIEPVQVTTGQDIDLTLTFMESTGVEHVALHFVDENNDEISESDPMIIFDKGTVTKSDPEGILSDNITFSNSKDGNKYSFNFGFSFDQPGNRHIMIVAWDPRDNQGTTKVFDAFAASGEPIPEEGINHMIYLDLGAYFITPNGIMAAGEKPNLVQPVIEFDYPDSVGKMERHDGIIYDIISNEKARANQVMFDKFNLDTEKFVANDEVKPYDTTRRASELSLSTVGHKIRDFTLSPDENGKLIKELSWKEHLKAQKLLDSLLVASKYQK